MLKETNYVVIEDDRYLLLTEEELINTSEDLRIETRTDRSSITDVANAIEFMISKGFYIIPTSELMYRNVAEKMLKILTSINDIREVYDNGNLYHIKITKTEEDYISKNIEHAIEELKKTLAIDVKFIEIHTLAYITPTLRSLINKKEILLYLENAKGTEIELLTVNKLYTKLSQKTIEFKVLDTIK